FALFPPTEGTGGHSDPVGELALRHPRNFAGFPESWRENQRVHVPMLTVYLRFHSGCLGTRPDLATIAAWTLSDTPSDRPPSAWPKSSSSSTSPSTSTPGRYEGAPSSSASKPASARSRPSSRSCRPPMGTPSWRGSWTATPGPPVDGTETTTGPGSSNRRRSPARTTRRTTSRGSRSSFSGRWTLPRSGRGERGGDSLLRPVRDACRRPAPRMPECPHGPDAGQVCRLGGGRTPRVPGLARSYDPPPHPPLSVPRPAVGRRPSLPSPAAGRDPPAEEHPTRGEPPHENHQRAGTGGPRRHPRPRALSRRRAGHRPPETPALGRAPGRRTNRKTP